MSIKHDNSRPVYIIRRANTCCPGRRQDPAKQTPLRSKQADIQNGHQVADTSRWRRQWTTTTATSGHPALLSRTLSLEVTVHRRHKPDLCFPLSADHLIHLVQLNVYRAFLANMLSLGRTTIFACGTDLDEQDGRVLASVPRPPPRTPVPLSTPVRASIPPLLEPTPLQQTTSHADWIDLFPLPALRDTLIRAHGTYDDCALYVDVLGSIGNKSSMSSGDPYYHPPIDLNGDERTGVVVWSDPWLVTSWELEEGFVRRWGWLLRQGCGELLRATDRWRRLRGDEPMDWARFGVAV